LRGHTSGITSLGTLPNDYLASGSGGDFTVKVWNYNTGSLVYNLTGHTSGVYALATLPNGNLAFGSGDYTVRI